MNVFQILHLWKIQLTKMCLTNNPLVSSWLNFGQFAFFNPKHSPKRNILNRLIMAIVLFNLVKLFVIALAAWLGFPDLKLWLIELYIFAEEHQKRVDIAILVMQLGFYVGFSYWVTLDGNARALNSFRFLLISEDPKNHHRYAQRYQLDPQTTNKFFSLYRLACKFLKLLTVGCSIFDLAGTSRCLYHSFYEVNLLYLLTAGLLLWAVTFVGYLLLIFYAVSRLILVLLSAQFLIYRAKRINALIYNRFIKEELFPACGPKKLRKQKATLHQVLHYLSDFCQQFQQINSVLDSSISVYLAGLFTFLFTSPFFLIFVKNDLSIQIFFILLVIVLYMLCFSFSICNDRLRIQVSQVKSN